jgi:N-acetylornithine carbamoyltransferase
MKRFLDLDDLSDDRLEAVLRRARELEHAPYNHSLRGNTVGLLFMNPSLRTLASMEAGIAQLGGTSFTIIPGQGSWTLETRDGTVMDGDAVEHVREAIPVLAEYASALGVRCFAKGKDLAEDLADGLISSWPTSRRCRSSTSSRGLASLPGAGRLETPGLEFRAQEAVRSLVGVPRNRCLMRCRFGLAMAARRGCAAVLRPGPALPGPIMAKARGYTRDRGLDRQTSIVSWRWTARTSSMPSRGRRRSTTVARRMKRRIAHSSASGA